jgi:hypothetical protein
MQIGRAQSYAPYSAFQSMSVADMATLQVKLTYLGPQERSIATRAFTSPVGTIDLTLFGPFERPGFDYINDDSPPVTFTVSQQHLKNMIDSVATLPAVTDGGIDVGGILSFALLNTAHGTQCFESILNQMDGRALFAKIRSAVVGETAAIRRLDEMACEVDMVALGMPSEVTTNVSTRLSGVRLDRSTGQFVGLFKLTNTGGTALTTPLTVVLDLDPNVELVGETGRTCRLQPNGAQYLDILTSGSLTPGASISRVLRFENPDLDPIHVTPRVFAGPGAR